MRNAGISSAGIDGDLDGIEDTADEGPNSIDGGDGTGPDTVTGDDIAPSGGASNEQTI